VVAITTTAEQEVEHIQYAFEMDRTHL